MNIVQDLTGRLKKKRVLSAVFILISLFISGGVCTALFLSDSLLIQLLGGLLIFIIGLGIFIQQGWFNRPPHTVITRFLDRNYPFVEESSSLFVQSPKTVFETWQLEKINEQVEKNREQIHLPNRLLVKSAIISASILLFTALIGITSTLLSGEVSSSLNLNETEQVSVSDKSDQIPEINEIEITISPPDYTNRPQQVEGFENISLAEGSELKWNVSVNSSTDSVWIRFGNQFLLNLERTGQTFEGEFLTLNNQIYQIGIANPDTTIFTDYRAISMITDTPPQFVVHSPAEMRSMVTDQNRRFSLDVQIIDDYKVTNARVQATLAKGTGENVRFRERSIPFDNTSGLNSPNARGTLLLNADSLEMEPGDELYLFVTATDNKPDPQTGRSETYFIIYQDTTRAEQAPFGSIAVDLMPEYFRSQRQIIIDTEELLEDKPHISEREFKQRSNTIGQNQGLLRLRYGEYLGLEDETGGMPGAAPSTEIVEEEGEDHDHEHEEDINEQGLERSESEAAAITPEDFLHDHGSAEMNTLFAESPRALLKESLANMWDAELYLRTYRPETALPYEHKALELLKQVQQANRQYVRKVGYELSPIPVDETRLTGTYDDFANPGEEFTSEFEKPPLAKLELLIREGNLDGIQQAENWVQLADISDADRLFILNRLRRISEDGLSDELKKSLLDRLSGIEQIREYDPAPTRRPVLGSLPENR